MSASMGAYLAPAVALLSSLLAGVEVSGPSLLPTPEEGSIPPTVIAQVSPGATPGSFAQVQCLYTLRCYGTDDTAVLGVWDLLEAALRDAETGEPLGPRLVTWDDAREDPPRTRRYWLHMAQLSAPVGPTPDPEANWPVIVGTATMRWGHKEV